MRISEHGSTTGTIFSTLIKKAKKILRWDVYGLTDNGMQSETLHRLYDYPVPIFLGITSCNLYQGTSCDSLPCKMSGDAVH